MRSALLVSLGAVGAILAACGSDGGSGDTSGANDAGSTSSSTSSSSSGGSSSSSSGSSGAGDAGSDGSSSGGDGADDPPFAVVFSSAAPIGLAQRTPVDVVLATNGALDEYTYSADEAPMRGMAAVYNVFKDATSGVGRWSDGTLGGKFNGETMPFLNGSQGYHYGWVARPSAIPAPTAGTYTMLGGSQPTIDDGSLALGTLSGASAATAIDGANMRLGIQLTFTMPMDATYTVTTTGGAAAPATSAVVSSGQLGLAGAGTVASPGAACQGGGACSATFTAMRTAGNDRIVVAYAITAGATGKTIRGSLAFGKD